MSIGLIVASLAAAATPRHAPDAHVVRGAGRDVLVVEEQRPPARDAYVAPYPNWRYTAVRRGDRLEQAFYATRYVIADPARYGLPAARANRRWIRYGGDLLLVDVRNGFVVRVASKRFATADQR